MEYSTGQVENMTKAAFECSDMSDFTLRQKLVLQIPCYSCFLFLVSWAAFKQGPSLHISELQRWSYSDFTRCLYGSENPGSWLVLLPDLLLRKKKQTYFLSSGLPFQPMLHTCKKVIWQKSQHMWQQQVNKHWYTMLETFKKTSTRLLVPQRNQTMQNPQYL